MIFSNLAIQTKRKAPNAHTFLGKWNRYDHQLRVLSFTAEIMRIRYGRFVHFSFMFFALAANILVVSSVLLGGAAAINAITGVSIYASLWLLPLGVAAYNIRGGLRATILTDYVHTAIILIILLIFAFKTCTPRWNPFMGVELITRDRCNRIDRRIAWEDVGVASRRSNPQPGRSYERQLLLDCSESGSSQIRDSVAS